MSEPTGRGRPPVLVRLAPFLCAIVFAVIAVKVWVTGNIPLRRGSFRPATDAEAGLFGAAVLALGLAAGFVGVRRWRRGG